MNTNLKPHLVTLPKIRRTLLGILCILAVSIAGIHGATPRATMVLTETLGEHIACERFDGEVSCDVVVKGRSKLSARGDWSENISTFNRSTSLSIQLGDESYEMALGDDPSYQLGKRRASFNLFNEEDRIIGRITFRWSAKGFTVRAFKITSADSPSIVAADYLGEEGDIEGSLDANLTFGAVSYKFELDLSGNAKTRAGKRGGEVYSLNSVSLRAAGDGALVEE